MTFPDVIGITETWEKGDFVLNGYHPPFRKDRLNQKGGGVMLFVKDHLKVINCPELDDLPFEDAVWCVVSPTRGTLILVGLCYRSPASSSENDAHLNNLIQATKQVKSTSALIMGDFNYGHINWEDGSIKGMPDSAASRFAETTGDLFLYQHVDFPTRFREGCVPSQLDLVFSNDELMVDELASSSPIGKSDHVVLTWHYYYKHAGCPRHTADKHFSSQSLDYKRGNYSEMTSALSKIDWAVMEHMEIEEAWKFVLSEIHEKVRKHVPVLRYRKRNHKMPWW